MTLILSLLDKQTTVKTLLVATATIDFDDLLLRPLFEGGYYLRAATNNDFTVYRHGTYKDSHLNW